jgi:hypothetical protein
MYVLCVQPGFEMVKEGGILHFVSGSGRFYSILIINVFIISPDVTRVILVHFVRSVQQMVDKI